MKISLSEIQDYIKCPLFYQMKYVSGIKEEPSINQQINDQMHRIIYFFFYHVMNKKLPKLENLKSKWESAWFQGIEPLQYILSPKDEKLEAGQKAIPMIANFYEANYLSPGMPLAIEQNIEVELGDHQVSGNLEIVREIQEGPRRLIEICIFKTGTQVMDQWSLDLDLNSTFQSYAFRRNYSAKEQRILLHYLRSDKKLYTMKLPEQYERMSSTVNMIARGISRGVFYPRETYLCKSCVYRTKYCSLWK